MTIDTDFHSHVARSSAYEMVQTAQKKGLRVLGLSEHVFQMTEARPLLEHMPRLAGEARGDLWSCKKTLDAGHAACYTWNTRSNSRRRCS